MASSLRTLLPSRTATSQLCSRCLPLISRRSISQASAAQRAADRFTRRSPQASTSRLTRRAFTTTPSRLASSPTAAEAMERIEELYDTAAEEFQIAAEETEGNTVYAADDRDAAKAEVQKLEEFYKSVVEGTGYDQEVKEEVKRRAGQRVRELVNAMMALEEKAIEHD